MTGTWGKICGAALKGLGWTADNDPSEHRIAVILAVPHTSIWDFLICYLYYESLGIKPHALVKKEMFFWPMGTLLRAMGGIPLDRKNPTVTIKSTIDRMRDSDEVFHIAMSPEGTRKPVKKWKTGYHTIAKALDCPVLIGYLDWKTKHIGYKEAFHISDDARKDTADIQEIYDSMNLFGKHPENYVTK